MVRLLLVLPLLAALLAVKPLYAISTVKSEFDYQPKKWNPMFFGSSQYRGQDNMAAGESLNTLGFGAAILYNVPTDKIWRGHKFFYYYMDIEVQQEWNAARVDEELKPIIAVNPGILVRSYIPFMKVFYGGGLNFRFGGSDYEPWAIYGQFGVEIYRFFISTRLMGTPGQSGLYNELRFGYLFSPTKKNRRPY